MLMPAQNNLPCHYYLRHAEYNHLQPFTEKVDALLQDSPQAHKPVVDDHSYELQYSALTQIMLIAADACFTLPQQHGSHNSPVWNETIQLLVCEVTALVTSSSPLRLGQLSYRSCVILSLWLTSIALPIKLTCRPLDFQTASSSTMTVISLI